MIVEKVMGKIIRIVIDDDDDDHADHENEP